MSLVLGVTAASGTSSASAGQTFTGMGEAPETPSQEKYCAQNCHNHKNMLHINLLACMKRNIHAE